MSLRSSTLDALRNQRVTITHAGVLIHDRPTFIEATVRSGREERRTPYVVLCRESHWSCTCHRGETGEVCAHICATQMVTGWPSAAALKRAL